MDQFPFHCYSPQQKQKKGKKKSSKKRFQQQLRNENYSQPTRIIFQQQIQIQEKESDQQSNNPYKNNSSIHSDKPSPLINQKNLLLVEQNNNCDQSSDNENEIKDEVQFRHMKGLEALYSFHHEAIPQGKNKIIDDSKPVKLNQRHPYNCFVWIRTIYQNVVQTSPNSSKVSSPKKAKSTPNYKNNEILGLGGLIARGIILTAAHVVCPYLDKQKRKSVQITFQNNQNTYIAQQIIIHPNYYSDTSLSFEDMAIIIIKKQYKTIKYPKKFLQIKFDYSFKKHGKENVKVITYNKRQGWKQSDQAPDNFIFNSILTYRNFTSKGDSGSLVLYNDNGIFKVIGIHLGEWKQANCCLLFSKDLRCPTNMYSEMIEKRFFQQKQVNYSTQATPGEKKNNNQQLNDSIIKELNISYISSDEYRIKQLQKINQKSQAQYASLQGLINEYQKKESFKRPAQMQRLFQNTSKTVKVTKNSNIQVKQRSSQNFQYYNNNSPKKTQINRRQNALSSMNYQRQIIKEQQSLCEMVSKRQKQLNQFNLNYKQYNLQQYQNQYSFGTKKVNNQVQNNYQYQGKQIVINRQHYRSQLDTNLEANIQQRSQINFNSNHQKQNRNQSQNPNQNKNKVQKQKTQPQQQQNCLASLCLYFYHLFAKKSTQTQKKGVEEFPQSSSQSSPPPPLQTNLQELSIIPKKQEKKKQKFRKFIMK